MTEFELTQRVQFLESKLQFVMHTLSMSRRNNSTGETDSRTLEELFQEAATHAMDGKTLAQVAAGAFGQPPPVGTTVPATPGPDGHPGEPGEGPTPLHEPADASPPDSTG